MAEQATRLNVQNAGSVCDTLNRAAEANLACPLRSGALIDLGHEGRLTVAGDLHDHRDHFIKVCRFAALNESPRNYLVIQEMIHGEKLVNGLDLSYRLLVEAAALSLQFPDQVHLLLANHELAQINGDDISKHGVSSVAAFNQGLEFVFGDETDDVRLAIVRYVRSLPLALRCANGVMCCHSLPSQYHRARFDPMVLTRMPTREDLLGPTGSAYLLVWGRNIAQSWATDLASLWNVELFLLGHQPAEMGYELCGDTMIILNSDHEHGVVLPVNLAQRYSRVELVDEILPLAAMHGGLARG